MIEALALISTLIIIGVQGFWLMGKVDRFLEKNRKRRWERKE